MNQYLKNVNRIEFVVTLACTGRCKHCSEGEHKNSGESIDQDIAAQAIRKIAEQYHIQSIMTFGGEPLICPDTVCKIHSAAREMNISKRQLITNGYFSKDFEKIQLIAGKIVESGVNDILLSVDAFHQEIIPLEYVKAFAASIRNTNIRLRTHPAWLVSCDADNPYNRTTKEILKEFESMGIEASSGNVIFPDGNALKYLKEYFNDVSGENQSPYWEDPQDVRSICFSANGDVLNGNIYKQDICDILSSYMPEG